MTSGNIELMQYISYDVKKNAGICHFVTPGRFERLFVKRKLCSQLHPDPFNDFSVPEIGPHFGIINEYCARFASPSKDTNKLLDEPLLVEKISAGEYRILDGHHRWAAAMKMGIYSLPVKIVNLTHEDDYRKMMRHSRNEKQAVFEFDGVICDRVLYQKEERVPQLKFGSFEKKYGERLREGIPALMLELQRRGYDVWICTKAYISLEYIQNFFKAYGIKADGIINAGDRKKSPKEEKALQNMLAEKYKTSYYIENDIVTCNCHHENRFESYELDTSEEQWENEILNIIK